MTSFTPVFIVEIYCCCSGFVYILEVDYARKDVARTSPYQNL